MPALVIPEGIAHAAEPFEQRSAPCPLCFTVMTTTAGGIQGLTDHLERCEQASPEDRVFYREHRRWPSTPRQLELAADTRWLKRQEKRVTEFNANRKPEPPNVPLKCRGCELDISNGGQVHPRETDCSWGKRYWRARDAREANAR